MYCTRIGCAYSHPPGWNSGIYPNMMQPIPHFKYNRAGKKFQKEQPQGNENESQPTEQQQQEKPQEPPQNEEQ